MGEPPSRSMQNLTYVLLDMETLSPRALKEELDCEIAVGILAGHLRNPIIDRERLVGDLMVPNNLFPFVLSLLDDTTTTILIQWFEDSFPRSIESYTDTVASQLLAQLSMLFLRLQNQMTDLQDKHRRVQAAVSCLNIVSSLSFPIQATALSGNNTGPGRKQKSQRERKVQRAQYSRRASSAPDSRPFDELNLDVPTSADEAADLVAWILQEQSRILQSYLQAIRRPELAVLIREVFFVTSSRGKQGGTPDDHVSSSATTNSTAEIISPVPSEGSVYPQVQPLQAALHFDTVDGFGDWNIHITGRAESDLRFFRRRDPKLFDIVLKKIKELSHGQFSRDNHKQLDLAGSDIQIPIYEAKMTGDSRLVYQVDCVTEYIKQEIGNMRHNGQCEQQVLRVFGIYTHKQMKRRFWKAVSHNLGGKGSEYRDRCTFRTEPLVTGDNVISPASWPSTQETRDTTEVSLPPDLPDEEQLQIQSLLVTNKDIPLSQAVLTGILNDEDVAALYLLSRQEQDVVYHSSSCYVLGRSGTGKTTTMLFKIFGIERAWQQYCDTTENLVPRPRQVFVTQSAFLARKVQEAYTKLSHMLAMEHGHHALKPHAEEERALVDMDEEAHWHSTLPRAFSQLDESHFPLFVTYSMLCEMLEQDFKSAKASHNHTSPIADRLEARTMSSRTRQVFVSYMIFLRAYWPHFPEQLKKQFDPAQIFAEFMGVIKGSERALRTQQGYLTREEYTPTQRRSGVLSVDRDTIYDLFEAYLKVKRRRGEYDAADRTYRIFCGLRRDGIPGRKVDYVYVDEVQDNLLTDTFILRSICRNPNGLFWAGDTAQTISAGSSFKFNELKAFQWRLEANAQKQCLPAKNPRLFQLVKNYRSHGGIVKCAQSILDLLMHFWPDSIDHIADETDSIPGPTPIFFPGGFTKGSAGLGEFLLTSSADARSETGVELGAQGCILVRDDTAREQLRSEVGDTGIIMTLDESKGLEFDDVLLYNFFADSTVDLLQWKVILNILPEPPFHWHCPSIDRNHMRYSNICRELKFLYVAVTRARHNLWITDSSSTHEPMLWFWQQKGLIRIHKIGDKIPRLATTSTAEEWSEIAHELFQRKQYEEAAKSFGRAGRLSQKAQAIAFHLRQTAELKPHPAAGRGTAKSSRSLAFLSAAEAFSACAVAGSAFPSTSRSYHRNAAECYANSGDDARAGDEFQSASEYTMAAQYYRRAGLFDKAIHILRVHRDAIPPDIVDGIKEVAKMHYVSKHELKKAMTLFESEDKAIYFMEEYGFKRALTETLLQSGRLVKAAELQLSLGNIVDAIDLFLQDGTNSTSRERAQQCSIDNLWRCRSLGVIVDREGDTVFRSLLQRSNRLLENPKMSSHDQDLLRMFRLIVSRDYHSLQDLGVRFHREHRDNCSALLCLDTFFTTCTELQPSQTSTIVNAPIQKVANFLEIFFIYAQEMQNIARDRTAFLWPRVQRLLGYRTHDDPDTFLVFSTSVLNSYIPSSKARTQVEGGGYLVSASEMPDLLRRALDMRLLHAVQREDVCCKQASAFRTCPRFALFGICKEKDCTNANVEHSAMDFAWFHTGIRILLLQIMIVQTVINGTSCSRLEQLGWRRFWLSKLYHALYPPHRRMGSIGILDLTLIPESDRAIPIVNEWVRDVLNTVHDGVPPPSYLTTISEASHLAFAFDSSAAREYLPRTPFVNMPPSHALLLRENQYHVVHDLLQALDGSSPVSISAGILFFAHVCSQRLIIDISILCHILDWLCMSIVVAAKAQKSSSLHNITIPSSWISATRRDDHKGRDLNLRLVVLEQIRGLIAQVHYASGHLNFEGRPLWQASRQTRQMFVFRICQTITLFGYNTPFYETRRLIHQAITSLVPSKLPNGFVPSLPSIYIRYVQAHDFHSLVKAMRHSEYRYGTSLDHLIQLKDQKLVDPSVPIYTPFATHTIVFNEQADIYKLLAERIPQESIPPMDWDPVAPALDQSVEHQAEESGQGRASLNEQDDEDEDADEDESDEEDLVGDHDLEEDQEYEVEPAQFDIAAATSLVNAANSLQSVAPPTSVEIDAAVTIQTAYRIHRWHRRAKRQGLDKTRDTWFLKCRQASQDLPSTYRRLFLGALPHILLCLENAVKHAQGVKKLAMLSLHEAEHDKYEVLKEAYDRAMASLKTLLQMQEALKPTSSLHSRNSPRLLREHIEEAADLSQFGLSKEMLRPYAWDLEMALTVVSNRRKEKPEVNMETEFV